VTTTVAVVVTTAVIAAAAAVILMTAATTRVVMVKREKRYQLSPLRTFSKTIKAMGPRVVFKDDEDWQVPFSDCTMQERDTG
jgi:ABC-type branched-subunit amino acid transport system substrate-binding protein